MTVGCPSNGRVLLQSLLFLLQPLKQAPAGLPGPSSPRPAMLSRRPTAPSYSHRWPTIPLLTHTCCYSPAMADEPVNPRTVVIPSAWETTVECSRPPHSSLPRPRHHPPPWCSRHGLVNVVMNDIHRKWTMRGEADSWVHGRTQGNASLLRAK